MLSSNPQLILLRWINAQLKESGSDLQVNNIGSDLADSVALLLILHKLDPTTCPTEAALAEQDLNTRAFFLIQNSINIGVNCIVTPEEFIKNDKLKEVFCSHIFNIAKKLEKQEIEKQVKEALEGSGTKIENLEEQKDQLEGEIGELMRKKQQLEDEVNVFNKLIKEKEELEKQHAETQDLMKFEEQLKEKANQIVELNNKFKFECKKIEIKAAYKKKKVFEKGALNELNKKLKGIYDHIGAKIDTNLEQARQLYKLDK